MSKQTPVSFYCMRTRSVLFQYASNFAANLFIYIDLYMCLTKQTWSHTLLMQTIVSLLNSRHEIIWFVEFMSGWLSGEHYIDLSLILFEEMTWKTKQITSVFSRAVLQIQKMLKKSRKQLKGCCCCFVQFDVNLVVTKCVSKNIANIWNVSFM